MPAYIQSISTAVPDQYYEQDYLRDRMKEYLSDDRATKSIIHRVYSKSGIDKRHTVINDFNKNGHPRFFFQKDGSLTSPSTGNRNKVYSTFAKKLFVETARNLLDQTPDLKKEEITHVITVSCTGFFAPEPAYEIVKQLGLSKNTERYHLGFMGCFAAFPALKMASSFCRARPESKVMVICLELCSLHLQDSEQTDHIISASVFGDGAAGAIIGSEPAGGPGLRLDRFATSIAAESEGDMAWTIGDTGFDMVLSTYVPDIIKSNLEDSVLPLFEQLKIGLSEIKHWAVHPGGRSILDKIEANFGLEEGQLNASRKVLSEYGNMSSATVLFVLKQLLEDENVAHGENVLSMAFGPGLTIESSLLVKVNQGS